MINTRGKVDVYVEFLQNNNLSTIKLNTNMNKKMLLLTRMCRMLRADQTLPKVCYAYYNEVWEQEVCDCRFKCKYEPQNRFMKYFNDEKPRSL